MQPKLHKQPNARIRDEHLSKDGKWRSFPKVPHLLQYVISGNYFGKVKINGNSVRKSLQTTVWTTAQLRLNEFLEEHRETFNPVDGNGRLKLSQPFALILCPSVARGKPIP